MQEKIKQLVAEANIGNLISHSNLSSGFDSEAHSIKTNQGDFVLLETKKLEDQKTPYKEYYAVLKCLQKNNYQQAPKPIHISLDGRSMIITKVEGKEVSKLGRLSNDEKLTISKNLTDQLVELEKITYQDLSQEFTKQDLEKPPIFTEQIDWQTYVLDTFYPYKNEAPADSHVKWIEEQIPTITIFDDSNWSDLQLHHCDTTAVNILVNDDLEVTLIDWGSASFYKSAKNYDDYGLAYTFNHASMFKELKEQIIEYLAAKKDLDPEMLTNFINSKQQSIKLADINWAFMMYTKANQGKTTDTPELFKKILDQRVAEYKATYL